MYNAYFGFREAPFSITPDPRFFYTNALYQEALATLRYGIEGKKGFVAITGEAGTGKTTLLRKLMRSLEATIHSVFIFNTHFSFVELLRITLRDLSVAEQKKDKFAMIEQLNNYLMEQAGKGHIVSLLIDEAQNLSDKTLEGLRLLSNLETDKEKLLQIVLMGQPELERKLDRPGLRQLKQRVALQCRLVPLDGSEVSPYIDLRLQAACYEGEALFDADAIEQIALYSRGVPRLINIICDNALLMAYATSQKKVSLEMIREVAHDIRLGLETHVAEKGTPTDKVTSREDKDGILGASTDGAAQYRPEIITAVPHHVQPGLEFQAAEAEASTDKVTPREGKGGVLRESTKQAPQYRPRHPVRAGVWTSLLLILFGGAASVSYTIHAKNRVSGPTLKAEQKPVAERRESLKEDPYDWLARVADTEPVQTLAEFKSSEADAEPQGKRLPSRIANRAKSERVETPAGSDSFSEFRTSPQDTWLASPILRAPEAEKGQMAAKPDAVSESEAYAQGSEAANPSKEPLVVAEQPRPDRIQGTTAPAAGKRQTKIYRVKEGDHLYAILRKQFGIDRNEELRDALNRVKELNLWKTNWDVLSVGEKIVFPRQTAAVSRSQYR